MIGLFLSSYCFFDFCTGLDVGFFKAEMLLAVDDLKDKTESEGGNAERCEHHKRSGIVVADCGLLGCKRTIGKSLGYIRIGVVEHLAYE